MPMRGREFVPRRIYTKPADYITHGYTQGCRGCTWIQNQIGPRAGHSEVCRERIERAIAEDVTDDRAAKAKERLDHYVAQQTEPQVEVAEERVGDPREEVHEPDPVQPADAEYFEIGSPGKNIDMEGADDLDDGPASVSERRFRSPIRAPPTKRRNVIHEDEPDLKKIILDEPSDNEDNAAMGEHGLSAVEARRADERIVCQAILGENLHDVYSNERIALAINRQSAEYMMSQGVPAMPSPGISS